ncbi:DME family drug/metabolite transporter [Stackebrandtia albiflava]|uniref:DME family drug/metabolite transporter n=1 Tax=Stackebrandtia albiflava TaxID=406432 RepID=A0A562VB12_9ACTN|nr:EamA family transporter [Stackebrandtia albiflava]TWJ15055.1 DME family drug/metabolite transporter [Stackebrandtia albiflava]
MSTDVSLSRSHHSTRRTGSGAALVLAAGLLWGTTGTSATFAPPGTSPLAIGAATMGLGGLLLFLTCARPSLRVLTASRRHLRLAVAGAVCVAVYPLTFYTSMSMAGVAIGTVVSIGASPVFAALFEWLGDGTRLSGRWVVATAATVLGCGLLVGAGAETPAATGRVLPGVLLALVAAASYAGYTYLATRLMRPGRPSRSVMGAMFGLGAVLLLPVLAVTSGDLLTSRAGWLVVGYLAVVPMFLAYLLFGAGIRRVGASAGTTLSVCETVVATVLGVLVVGERLGPVSWAGVALVVAGLATLTLRLGASGRHRPKR